MKEFFEAFNNRIRGPVFGYFILAFIAVNWKAIYFILFSSDSILKRFEFFDNNTNVQTLLYTPLIFGVACAIAYPWISWLFIVINRKPTELRELSQIRSKAKYLFKEQELENLRSKLLSTKEDDLIDRAKRDQEIQNLEDVELRKKLQSEIVSLRNEVDNDEIPANSNGQDNLKSRIDILMQMGKMYDKKGLIDAAERYYKEALELTKYE